jgi:hypothetical protein
MHPMMHMIPELTAAPQLTAAPRYPVVKRGTHEFAAGISPRPPCGHGDAGPCVRCADRTAGWSAGAAREEKADSMPKFMVLCRSSWWPAPPEKG